MSPDNCFAWAFEHVYDVEKGLVDNPNDPGGITNHGVSLRFAVDVGDLDKDGRPDLDVDGNGQVDANDIRRLTKDQAQQIFRAHFWDKMSCGLIPSDGLALLVFDTGVNQGRGPAISILQETLRVKADGRPGPATMAAAQGTGVDAINEFTARRALRYARTANIDTFGLGWMRRMARMHELAVQIERA